MHPGGEQVEQISKVSVEAAQFNINQNKADNVIIGCLSSEDFSAVSVQIEPSCELLAGVGAEEQDQDQSCRCDCSSRDRPSRV